MNSTGCMDKKLRVYYDGVMLFELDNFTINVSHDLKETRSTERIDGKLVTKVSCNRDIYPRKATITGDIIGTVLGIGGSL